MKKHLILTNTKDMSRDNWLRYRKRGVGASDVGTILGLNQYKANIELFYERVSEDLEFSVESLAAFMGREQEDFIAELWEYWDGTIDGTMKNYREGRKCRRCQRVNAYVSNPDYPWLFVSLDRKINKGTRGEEGALEIKTIAGYEADKWDAQIPPGHIVQVQTQLLVCDFSFGEIASLRDGRQFDVFPFEANPIIQQRILEATKDFWDRVTEARRILTQIYEAKKGFNMNAANDLRAELEQLEPEPDGSEAYEKFMKKKFSIAEEGLVPGGLELLHVAQEHKRLKEKAKKVDEEIRLQENRLKRAIGDKNALDFGGDGRVTWRGDVNKVRRFVNSVKV